MLDCHACIQRCVRTVFADAFHTRHHPLKLRRRLGAAARQPQKAPSWLRRGYQTQAVQAGDRQELSDQGLPPVAANQHDGGSSRLVEEPSVYKRADLAKELRWLGDPLKLADHTVRLLRQDDYFKALALVRLASRDMECTVSWNHLVDYDMTKGKVAAAVKTYNEMKKRAQTPDAHTYTTIFRGLSWNVRYPSTLDRALSIYHSMFTEDSPVKPSIIHTNAVLKVCALSGNMDALLGVAARMPTRGKGSPTNLTYTIILNAIRNSLWEDMKGQKYSDSMRERQARAVFQGRTLWEEIRDKWAAGDLYIDEEMVCAMGRLLLLGVSERDHDDILSLIEQTTGIPRQLPPTDNPTRNEATKQLSVSSDPENADYDSPPPPASTDPPTSAFEDPTEISPFRPLQKSLPKASLVRPGRNTLSLVLDACIHLHQPRPAQDYWGLLTSPGGPYSIVPDSENYHMYLRLLRLQRASRLTIELVGDIARGAITVVSRKGEGTLQPKTFRIALSCCVRDKNNRNALSYAGKLYRIMTDTLEAPDPKALMMYLEVALAQRPRDWRVLLGAIRDTEPGVRNLKSLLAYDPNGREKTDERDVVEVARRLMGACDIVLDLGNEGMRQEDKCWCREQKHSLGAWVTRTMSKSKSRARASEKARRGHHEAENGNDEEEEQDEGGRREGEGGSMVNQVVEPSHPHAWRSALSARKRDARRAREKAARDRRTAAASASASASASEPAGMGQGPGEDHTR